MSFQTAKREVIGVIPAAGQATRISPLPCSKELFPVGFSREDSREGGAPKVVSHYLLEKMRVAGISKIYFILRSGKWDIPAYFGDGSRLHMHLAYLMLGAPFGVPFTLDQAYPFVRNATVAFGFPDILFGGNDGFAKLLSHQSQTSADVVLGLFPANHPAQEDVVDFEGNGIVRDIILRPSESSFPHTWGIAVWAPSFSDFLHDYVGAKIPDAASNPELSAGHVIKAAIPAGLRVDAVVLDDQPYLDIGTPKGLLSTMKAVSAHVAPTS
jgi:glucose-1-phosphate thymidylyltransferase